MTKVKQLNAVTNGKATTLDRICSALGSAKININGMMATGEVVRILVDDPQKASEVLDGIGVHNAVEEVLALELDHKPGAAAEVINKLAKREIKIRYAYGAAAPMSQKAIVVLSVKDMTEALEATR